jgi:hypothetical protein
MTARRSEARATPQCVVALLSAQAYLATCPLRSVIAGDVAVSVAAAASAAMRTMIAVLVIHGGESSCALCIVHCALQAFLCESQ